jgi:hypothetical protein
MAAPPVYLADAVQNDFSAAIIELNDSAAPG